MCVHMLCLSCNYTGNNETNNLESICQKLQAIICNENRTQIKIGAWMVEKQVIK